MKKLEIIWQRLVDENGNTCDRCNKTYLNLERAIERLSPLLHNLGFGIDFKKKPISITEFKKNPLLSNEIIINGNKIENILKLKIGKSECCGPCGDSECRTVIDDTGEKEEVEERLIIKAILKEVIEMI